VKHFRFCKTQAAALGVLPIKFSRKNFRISPCICNFIAAGDHHFTHAFSSFTNSISNESFDCYLSGVVWLIAGERNDQLITSGFELQRKLTLFICDSSLVVF